MFGLVKIPCALLLAFSCHAVPIKVSNVVSHVGEETCGLRPVHRFRRLVGGTFAAPHSWPWFGALFDVKLEDDSRFFKCGATLISRQWGVTAEHCLKNYHDDEDVPSVRLKLGAHSLGKGGVLNEQSQQIIPLTKIVRHDRNTTSFLTSDDDDDVPLNNDIVLFKLAHEVEINEFVSPICLPNKESKDPENAESLTTIGFGYTEEHGNVSTILKELHLKVVPQSECAKVYRTIFVSVSDRMICAQHLAKADSGTCNGDSGGPLMRTVTSGDSNQQERFELVGVTSWNYGCGLAPYADVFHRILPHLDWIRDVIAER